MGIWSSSHLQQISPTMHTTQISKIKDENSTKVSIMINFIQEEIKRKTTHTISQLQQDCTALPFDQTVFSSHRKVFQGQESPQNSLPPSFFCPHQNCPIIELTSSQKPASNKKQFMAYTGITWAMDLIRTSLPA